MQKKVEPIEKCRVCRGEGILRDTGAPIGFRVCRHCRGIGLVAIVDFAPPPPAELEPHELAPWSAHYEPEGAA